MSSLFLSFGVQSSLLSFGVQSHHHSQFRHSEPSSLSISAFRAIITSQFRRLEPSSLLSFGVQSHHHSQFRNSEPSSFLVSAFRAIITPQFQRSEWSLLIISGIQSHHHVHSLAFRAIISPQFGVQSYHSIMIEHSLPPFGHSKPHLLVFRAFIFFGLAFRDASLVRRSK